MRGCDGHRAGFPRDLFLSTVKRHVERIISKLGVSDCTQAAIKALELGIGPHDSDA